MAAAVHVRASDMFRKSIGLGTSSGSDCDFDMVDEHRLATCDVDLRLATVDLRLSTDLSQGRVKNQVRLPGQSPALRYRALAPTFAAETLD